MSRPKVSSLHNSLVATTATAKELDIRAGNPADDSEAAKSLARYINKSGHSFTSIMVSNHCGMPGNKVIDVLLSAAKPIRAV